MKKSSLVIFTSFLLVILIVLSGRGYTKDNSEYESIKIDTEEESHFDFLKKSVVQVFASREEGVSAFGTGFFFNSENKIITNYHVIEGAKYVYVTFLDDKYAYRADLYAYDKENDMAVLFVEDISSHDFLPLTVDVEKGESIYTCGFSDDYTITKGKVIDTKSFYQGDFYIDTSNVVMEGNSGGPAINNKGEVVGIVTLGNSVSTSLIPTYELYNFIHSLNYSLN